MFNALQRGRLTQEPPFHFPNLDIARSAILTARSVAIEKVPIYGISRCMGNVSDFFIARNEREICELFEDLLFWRTEKFAPSSRKTERGGFNKQGLNLLYKTGIINRIFRRWFQATWGWRTWTEHFDGETPRQELQMNYPEMAEGTMMLSVEMIKKENGWAIEPRLFGREELKDGAFLYGMQHLASREKSTILVPPNFDPQFHAFAAYLQKLERQAKTYKSYQPGSSKEKTYLKLFWFQAGPQLVFHLQLNLPSKAIMQIGALFQEYLDHCARSQGQNLNDFLTIDETIFHFWDILRHYDKNLLSYETMDAKDQESLTKHIGNRQYIYSVRTFYLLGHLFDELILFPLDRYFNGVEIVWTQSDNFIGSLATTVELMNSNCKLEKKHLNKKEERVAEFMNIEDTALDPERLWFCPPTCFRILPLSQQYLGS